MWGQHDISSRGVTSGQRASLSNSHRGMNYVVIFLEHRMKKWVTEYVHRSTLESLK